jgi:predicted NUDIX family phosphoesterase
MTLLEAINIVLSEGEALHVMEIWKKINKKNLWSPPKGGKTPWQTIRSKISVDIMKKGRNSPYVKVKPGTYELRVKSKIDYQKSNKYKNHPDVLVFNNKNLDLIQDGKFHSYRSDHNKHLSSFSSIKNEIGLKFIPREKAEYDESYKQFVNYVIFTSGDKVLRFIRGGEGSTLGDYFYDSFSIGFGGHVNKSDWDLLSWKTSFFGYWDSVFRELKEEIGFNIKSKNKVPIIGMVNDNSTDLGRKHFAFIHKIEVNNFDLSISERPIRDPKWIDIKDLYKYFHRFEHWSKLIIQALFSETQKKTCHILPTGVGSLKFRLKDQKKYISITGYIGSGKTLACQILEQDFGYHIIPGSKILKSLLGFKTDEKVERDIMQTLGLEFVNKKNGHWIFAKEIQKYISKNSAERYVLDGLRFPKTLKELERLIKCQFTTVYIESPVNHLINYYRKRRKIKISYDDFLKIVFHEVELEICKFFEISDVTIFNHGPIDLYQKELINYFKKELI